jgi:hypothetical protein
MIGPQTYSILNNFFLTYMWANTEIYDHTYVVVAAVLFYPIHLWSQYQLTKKSRDVLTDISKTQYLEVLSVYPQLLLKELRQN